MKYSYNWLRELTDTQQSPEQLQKMITSHAFEVEGLEKIGTDFSGVVVGKILEISKHPNADKLQLVRVDIGKNILNIVCGAHNISVGDMVPVATVGTILPNGLVMKEAEIRGEKSSGMLCAKDELGLGEDHSGIFILEKDIQIGVPFGEYLNSQDFVFDIDVLPNRAHDALSYVGMAREIVALEKCVLDQKRADFDYDYDDLRLTKKKSKKVSVKIENEAQCQRYIAAVMENIEIKESPLWMQSRLLLSGIRPINNIVDATNYVMLELGQPMHAFDFEQIAEKNQGSCHLVIRNAEVKERITLLDDVEIGLEKNNLLITNGKTPLAIAGVMGGKYSGINEKTRTIILESASFDASSVRRTRTSLGLRTDASDRFEKEIDSNLTEKAMVRIIEIIEHIANGKLEGIVDSCSQKVQPWKIKLDLEYVKKLLGEKITDKKVVQILSSVGLRILGKAPRIIVEIPTFRVDLRTPEDLIEEIGRIFGYDNISPQAIKGELLVPKINKERFFERKNKNILVGLGFDETYNYSFYGARDREICGLTKNAHLELANPMNPEQQFMQITLIPGVLKNIKNNLRNYKSMHIFEAGRVYVPSGNVLPEERKKITLAIVAESENDQDNFFSAKGLVETWMKKMGLEAFEFSEIDFSVNDVAKGILHATRSAQIEVSSKQVIGYFGEINPLVLSAYKISKRVIVAEIDLNEMMQNLVTEKKFLSLQKYPTVIRDISMSTAGKVTAGEILKEIHQVGGDMVMNAELFDVFQKEDEKNLAYHIEIGSQERTLASSEIDDIIERIQEGLEKKLKVSIRKK